MNPLPSLKLPIKLHLNWNRYSLIAHHWCREVTEELCLGERVWVGCCSKHRGGAKSTSCHPPRLV